MILYHLTFELKRGRLVLNRCQVKTYQVFPCMKLLKTSEPMLVPSPKNVYLQIDGEECKETWTMKILYNMCTQANYFTHKDKCPTWCTVSYRSDRWQRLLVCVHCSLHPILMAPTKRSYNNIHTTPLHSTQIQGSCFCQGTFIHSDMVW